MSGDLVDRLRAAILDIDAHAVPLGEDEDGFIAVGYAISVGCLHRALGVVGHSAAKCTTERPCNTCIETACNYEYLRETLETLARLAGVSLESGYDDGNPARNFQLRERLIEHLGGTL